MQVEETYIHIYSEKEGDFPSNFINSSLVVHFIKPFVIV